MSCVEAGALGMLFRIGRDRDLEIADGAQARDQIGGIGVAAGRRRIAPAEAALRIAAQGDDMAHADLPIAARDLVDLVARGADAGEMRGGLDRGLAQDARDGGMGALAGRAAGAIGHGDEIRAQRRETSIASHRVASISGGFGGKNSKETSMGLWCPRLRLTLGASCALLPVGGLARMARQPEGNGELVRVAPRRGREVAMGKRARPAGTR